jgi:hypothetical protein
MCTHKLTPGKMDLQRNALRVEMMTPQDRCALKPKKDNAGRRHDVWRWVNSGGDPITVAHPCSGNCPLRVLGEVGGYGSAWTAPCPICSTVNRLSTPGMVKCRDCKTEYEILFT